MKVGNKHFTSLSQSSESLRPYYFFGSVAAINCGLKQKLDFNLSKSNFNQSIIFR